MKLQFPTMLRKMWSGGEVQDWIDIRVEEIERHNVVIPREWLEAVASGRLPIDQVFDEASNWLHYNSSEEPENEDQ